VWLNMKWIDGERLPSEVAVWNSPCDLTVLPPGERTTTTGEVFDRQYMVEEIVKVQHALISNPSDVNAWADSASTLKSIRDVPTNDNWRLLINDGESPNEAIPQDLRKDVVELVNNCLLLDDYHFTLMLTQTQSFISAIKRELEQTIGKAEVASLCRFKYNAKVTFPRHEQDVTKWNQPQDGLFGWEHSGDKYAQSIQDFNNHLYNEFFKDFSRLKDDLELDVTTRDYYDILTNDYQAMQALSKFKSEKLESMHKLLDYTSIEQDLMDEVFNDLAGQVRFMNVVSTDIYGEIMGVFVANEECHIIAKVGDNVEWRSFDCTISQAEYLLECKRASSTGSYVFSPKLNQPRFQFNEDSDWVFRFANRDLSTQDKGAVTDVYLLPFKDVGGAGLDMWYLSILDGYVYVKPPLHIVDMAYEQNGDILYVLMRNDDEGGESDTYLHRFDRVGQLKDSKGRILLLNGTDTMKLETFHSVYITQKEKMHDFVHVDYTSHDSWKLRLYGGIGGVTDREVWNACPGISEHDFRRYNIVFFGDSLFDEQQLRFQNISKNKDMYDLLDMGEVDGCYYGLFKCATAQVDGDGREIYTVFKTSASGGVVQRLPYEVVCPHLFKTSDSMYSLYVVAKSPDKTKLQLVEITVPDSEWYVHRVIDVQDIIEKDDVDMSNGFKIHDIIMSGFKTGDISSAFFVLSNVGFHKIFLENDMDQLSIDDPLQFRTLLSEALRAVVMKHTVEQHDEEATGFFKALAQKINQFTGDFNTFSLIPTEFTET